MPASDKPTVGADLDVFNDDVLAAVREVIEPLPPPEPPVDPDMLARIDQARANPASGVPHEVFLKEFEL